MYPVCSGPLLAFFGLKQKFDLQCLSLNRAVPGFFSDLLITEQWVSCSRFLHYTLLTSLISSKSAQAKHADHAHKRRYHKALCWILFGAFMKKPLDWLLLLLTQSPTVDRGRVLLEPRRQRGLQMSTQGTLQSRSKLSVLSTGPKSMWTMICRCFEGRCLDVWAENVHCDKGASVNGPEWGVFDLIRDVWH